MDTYLYGLLGLSLAANAFSAIGSLVANSKKRDEENQRTISSIYEELNRKIDTFHNDTNERVGGLEDLLNRRLDAEVNEVREKVNSVEEDICDRLCEVEYQVELLNEESEMELPVASKKKRG